MANRGRRGRQWSLAGRADSGECIGFLVGAGREGYLQCVAKFVPFWRDEDDFGTCAFYFLGPIKEQCLALLMWQLLRLLCLFPVSEEFRKGLQFYCLAAVHT
jgi:hypothetical protein